MSKIVINALQYKANSSGIGVMIRELFGRYAKLTDRHCQVILPQDAPDLPVGEKTELVHIPSEHGQGLRRIFFQTFQMGRKNFSNFRSAEERGSADDRFQNAVFPTQKLRIDPVSNRLGRLQNAGGIPKIAGAAVAAAIQICAPSGQALSGYFRIHQAGYGRASAYPAGENMGYPDGLLREYVPG